MLEVAFWFLVMVAAGTAIGCAASIFMVVHRIDRKLCDVERELNRVTEGARR